MELVLVMHNIRSTYNVGAILRTAEGFGVRRVILSGWTPATKYAHGAKALPHVLEKNTTAVAKTALGAEKMLRCEWSEDVFEKLGSLRKAGYIIFGLENNLELDRVVEIDKWKETVDEIAKIVLILGEEVEGIDSSLFPMIDVFLEIPMKGQKESFNVSVAAGIAIYELLGRKSGRG